ncbi:MAG: hypothetical protein CML19_18165 [Pusillimonas sp.]|jgi:hypothetical protein|nr:hypothetical protein [Pusillimonas sp.]|tara:strand:- start:244 stop:672 length:429 start_codon:yes stop_codon:yes gene_type:complete
MTPQIETLTVKAVEPTGRRRAGLRWPHEPVTVPIASLMAEQIQALLSDPLLIVAKGTAPQEPDADPAPADAAPDNPPFDAEIWKGAIRAGMLALDPENAAHWTKSGLPDLSTLRAMPGLENVSSKERDELWAEIQDGKKENT